MCDQFSCELYSQISTLESKIVELEQKIQNIHNELALKQIYIQ
jgi:hypothetical protein